MARKVSHFRSSDLTFWGILAVAIWGVAMVGGSVSSFVPESWFAALHASRLDGASFSQMRQDVARLQSETARLKQENSVLLQRVMLTEASAGDATRRVGALEETVPQLIAAVQQAAPTQQIDPTTTASTTGSPAIPPAPSATEPAMPQQLVAAIPNAMAFGVALGPPIVAADGAAAWEAMSQKIGPLLIGLVPLLADLEGTPGQRLVAGPIPRETDARDLCGRVTRVGISCGTVRFTGTPLTLE